MNSLAGSVDAVIGVDTHRDTLAAAIVTPIGAVLASTQASADARWLPCASGLRASTRARPPLLGPRRRRQLRRRACRLPRRARGAQVEVAGRNGRHGPAARKSDAIDAVRAAREALSTEHLISPRRRGEREALRVLMSTRSSAVTARTRAANHLKALIVSAPETLRAELRGKTSDAQISYCSNLRSRPAAEHRAPHDRDSPAIHRHPHPDTPGRSR